MESKINNYKKVVHIAYTPVAGSPVRIVNALNKYTSYGARLVILNPRCYGNRTFPGDIEWQTDKDSAVDAMLAADILHIHQTLELEDAFGSALAEKLREKKIVRQFHSYPVLFFGSMETEDWFMKHKETTLVIAQCPHRYYPNAVTVPNLIGVTPENLGVNCHYDKPCIVYSPSSKNSVFQDRWETKGYQLVKPVLETLQSDGLCRYEEVFNQPFDYCLAKKREADLVVDDVVTGGYHLSGLEGLALGKPVIGYLDEPVQNVLKKITGASKLPWINLKYDDLEYVLRHILPDKGLLQEIGQCSYEWVKHYYNDEKLIKFYTDVYDGLYRVEKPVVRATYSAIEKWQQIALPDLLYGSFRHRVWENFLRQHWKIYLYGAGKIAGESYRKMSCKNIKVDGVITTQPKYGEVFHGMDVGKAEEVLRVAAKKGRVGVILAMNPKNIQSVRNIIDGIDGVDAVEINCL